MPDWIKFADLLPSIDDANEKGEVMARHHPTISIGGKGTESTLDTRSVVERPCLWDWVPPHKPDAKAIWEANGFTEWRPLRAATQKPEGRK